MDICKEAQDVQEGSMLYGKSDRWTPIHLDEGEKLYQLDMGARCDKEGNLLPGKGFFIDEDTYDHYWNPETNEFDIQGYCQDAQIAPYYDGTYKNHISEYVVGEGGIDVAYGTCENNTAFGEGGCSQIYVGENSNGELEKTNYQISPEISEADRYIGKQNASDMITNSVEENLHDSEYGNNVLPAEKETTCGENKDQSHDILPAENEEGSSGLTNENVLPTDENKQNESANVEPQQSNSMNMEQ